MLRRKLKKLRWMMALILFAVGVFMLWRAIYGVNQDVESLAKSTNPKDRLEAVVLLRDNRADSKGLLRKLAHDSSPMVSFEAISVLGKHRSDAFHETLKRLLDTSNEPDVRGAAAAALGNHEQTDPELLAALMKTTEDKKVRVGAAKGLARLGKHKRQATAPLLFKALMHPDSAVRTWAITGIYNVSSYQFPKYDAEKPPAEQEEVIAFIRYKLRGKKLMP